MGIFLKKAKQIKVLRHLLLPLLIVFIIVAIYGKTARYDFIKFDNKEYIIENPHVRNGLGLQNIKWAFEFTKTTNKTYWHPISFISHMVDCQLYGVNPFGHRLTNIVLHLLNAILLYSFLNWTTGAPIKSAFISILFAIHPINVESVIWIAERKNLLSSLFWLLAMMIYVSYVNSRKKLHYVILFIVITMGLLSKPMLVTLPFALVLLDVWPLGRIRIADGKTVFQPNAFIKLNKKLVLEKIPLFCLSFIFVFLSILSNRNMEILATKQAVPMDLRITNAIISYISYLKKIFWPFDLAIFYPFPSTMNSYWELILAGSSIAFFSYTAIIMFSKKPWLFSGWFWYLGTLIPVLGLVQAGIWPSMADRWAYIPQLGILIVFVWTIDDLLNIYTLKKFIMLSCFSLCAILSLLTWRQTELWKDSSTLFEHALNKTENNWFVSYVLGSFSQKEGDYPKSIQYYNDAIKLKPTLYLAYNNLGIIYEKFERYDDAMKFYEKALAIKPSHANALNNMGKVLILMERYTEAFSYFRKAYQFDPDSPAINDNMGNVNLHSGNLKQALFHYKKSLAIRPANVLIHHKIGSIYFAMGNLQTALEYYQSAIKLDPNIPIFYINIGNIYLENKQYPQSIQFFKKALNLDPSLSAIKEKIIHIQSIRHNG